MYLCIYIYIYMYLYVYVVFGRKETWILNIFSDTFCLASMELYISRAVNHALCPLR